MWIIPVLFSAVFLGIYDVLRKYSLNENAVIPVLFIASATGGVLFIPFVLLSGSGILTSENFFFIPSVSVHQHALFLIKSVIVGASWIFGYFAIRNLPLTIVVPIRSTAPMWTILGAIIIYSEKFGTIQWIGIITILIFFYFFSLAGKKEDINFSKNKWVIFIIAATLLGSASSLYDKYLLRHYDQMAVQAWFSIYMILVIFPFFIFNWFPKRMYNSSFRLSFAIPLIGVFLTISDFLYFYALSDKNSLVAVVSLVRRSNVIISFISGAFLFGERNIYSKSIALAGILAGVVLLVIYTIN